MKKLLTIEADELRDIIESENFINEGQLGANYLDSDKLMEKIEENSEVKEKFKFEELPEKSKEKALEKHWDINVNYDWWECMFEGAKEVGIKIKEFDIDRGSYCKGELLWNASDVMEAVIKEHGESCDTYKTAKKWLQEYNEKLHEINSIEGDKPIETDDLYSELSEIASDFEKEIFEDYLKILRDEYEYQTSKEAIIEAFEANNYDFDLDGNIC